MIRRLGFPFLALAGALLPAGADAADGARMAAPIARTFTFACSGPHPCRRQAGPGPADRQVQPFAGSLGRPCAYRRRETPSGPRTVRVCF